MSTRVLLDIPKWVCLDNPMPSAYTQNDVLMWIGEAADSLHVSVDTLRRWAEEGKVPAVRTPGGRWRFRREDIDAVYGRAS